MSRKGGQDGVKDGGAHDRTHEITTETEFLETGALFNNRVILNPQNCHNETPVSIIQNGGQNDETGCGVGVSELLSETDSDTHLGSFTTISVSNVEWFKAKCKSLDVGNFDCIGEKENGIESDDLFPDSRVEEGGGVASVGSCRGSDSVSQIVTEPLDSDLPTEDFTNQGVTVHFGEFTSDLKNRQEEFPLQNIMQHFNVKDSVSLMTPQELELLPNRGLEFDDSFVSVSSNYQTSDSIVNTSKSDTNSLISSYEGERKNDEVSRVLSTDLMQSKSTDEKPVSDPDGKLNVMCKTINTDLSQSVLNTSVSSVVSSSPSSTTTTTEGEPHSSGKSSESQTDQANLTLATISISTDKTANSTQILVNTNHGQQLYLINTADLTQATNALQPLAQPAVAAKPVIQELSSPPPVVAPTTTETKSSEVVVELPPSQVQAMPLQIQNTGYLLLPVAQQEGSNGILLTTPIAAIPSELACQSRKVWLCPEAGCDKVFRKLSKLKVHQMVHTGERPFKCSRSGCDWAFTTAYKLKRHEESHEGRKDYNCDFPRCGRKFTTVYNLNSHKRIHERPCTEECPEPECDQKFPTKRQLDLHIRTHTGLEKTYKCPVPGCDKVFFSPSCMGSHARVHLQDRQDLICKFEGCGKVFDKRCRLKQHERRHTGEKPYVCQFPGCDWAFPTASKLKRHKAKHTGLRKWVCNLCNKGFMRAEHLKGHLVTHSGVKPFVCPVEGCKARFTAKSSLYVHLKKHDASGKKVTYHCPMEGCERNYSSKAGLRNHILKHFLSTPSGSDPSAALDWVPLLGGDEDGTLEKLVQSSESGVTPGDNASLVQSVLSSIQEKNLTAADFVNPEGGSLPTLTEDDTDCLNPSPEQLSTTIVRQLISTSPLQGEIDVTVKSDSAEEGKLDVLTKSDGSRKISTLPPVSLLTSPIKAQPKIAIAADRTSGSTVSLENTSGSARTDYRSNHMLSERAKRRWHKMKNESGLEDEDSMETDITSTDGLEESGIADPASPLFPSPDILSSSQGVMFRDPETGITYVQTQLLQDDPPHPALYDDEGGGTSVSGTVSFTGTTINLQDLK